VRSPAVTQYSPATATTPACAGTWICREEYESIDGGWRFGRVEFGRSSDGLRSVDVELPKVDMPVSSSSYLRIFHAGVGGRPWHQPSRPLMRWEQDARAVERQAIELVLAFGKLVSVLC
jgi:hypothetical protein